MSQADNFQDDNQRGWRYASLLSLLFAIAILLSGRLGYVYLSDPLRFPINTIKIVASYQHLTHKQMEAILDNYLNYSFFSLPASRLQTDIDNLVWVDKVAVERIWPDAVKITIVEKKPVAIWNKSLMTRHGDLIPDQGHLDDYDLPNLSGPKDQAKEVLQVYQKLSKILSDYDLSAKGLALRDNLAWELTMANGVCLRLGKKDIENRLTRFCKAYNTVFAGKIDQLASIDMRYPRGMAVQWKQESEK